MSATRYFISLPEPAKAAIGGDFGFRSHSAGGFAGELQDALRSDGLFERWRQSQDEPDEVDPKLGLVDPQAEVTGAHDDLHVDLIVTTTLPGDILRHRMRLLAGNAWQLRDVRAA
ncbi:MAG: hypothetical protein Q4F49_03660 [Pseudoxanthomonas suwonensis]|nr:hypothetical protein [Pseudoxanthomonas suwonensis]